jgi:hypothetical protein
MRSPLTALALLLLVPAAPAKEELADKVGKAIEAGKDYLIKQQTRQGDWERDAVAGARPGGCTALALLALLNAGVPAGDPIIQKGLEALRGFRPRDTYVVGLQTMVYCLAGEDKQRIENNVKWLLDARRMDGRKLLGWPYQANGGRPDASNTQYALLGLHEAQQAGIKIDREVWDSIRDYYLNTQFRGGYGYEFDWGNNRPREDPRFTMTTAGLCGLIIAGSDLNVGRETPRGDGSWNNCGHYEENRAVANALEWLARRFPSVENLGTEPHLFYALYGIERAGRLTGLRFIGEHDWYRIGCEYLVERQDGDGSWHSNIEAGGPIVCTSFALLFLSKGRTPVLISKLTHDGKGQRDGVAIVRRAKDEDNDWNNDRSDARHLVEFASRELFKRKPMGWQVFNAREADQRLGPEELAAELLQSPIAYFNGHLAPEFTGKEEEMLQTYVRNGGLIFAEACCGRSEFHQGFGELMTKLFPQQRLELLPPDHPVWTASGKFAVSPKRFPLYGIQMGCKTVVIYSPKDLSCLWESNQYEDKGDAQMAFQLGANIIAYATGLEPPKPRLTKFEVVSQDREPRKVPRGYLRVGLVKYGEDSTPAREAMPNLMRELREKTGLDVQLRGEDVAAWAKDMTDYKFLYMHGRKSFSLPPEQLESLRYNLEHGGLLFADACCGSDAFNKSFREFITAVWPDQKYKLEPISPKDDLFGKELNGTAITSVRCRRENAGKRDLAYQDYEPFLEGVKIKGRWAVIYSRWDIGCALEKHKSPDCMGHDYDSAVKIGRAVVLYHLR